MTRSCIGGRPLRWLVAGTVFLALASASNLLAQQPSPPEAVDLDKVPAMEGANELRGILILPARKGAKTWQELLGECKPEGVTGVKGVVVKGPEFLNRPDLKQSLQKYLGFPFTTNSLYDLQAEIIRYCRAQGHLLMDITYPEQDILEGTVQIVAIEATVGKVIVTNAAPRRWFSDAMVLRTVQLKPGDSVNEAKLNSGLAWLNRNNYQSLGYEGFAGAFRDVTANFQQHGRDEPGELGKTDVQLKVQDRFPFRPFLGVDDTGIEVIGKYRTFAGFNWANVFGLDHRLTYQYITDIDFDKFHEHVGSYVIPLPWRHEFTLFGAYAHVDPDFSVIDPSLANLKNEGDFYQISARYSIPLPSTRRYDQEVTAGFDFKRTDTPLLFSGVTGGGLLRTNNVDIDQFSLAYSGRLKDDYGRTAFSLQGVYSPGGMTAHNHSSDFQDFQPGSDPKYLYGRAEVRRVTWLPCGFSLNTRAVGQLAAAKLVATEAWSLGGYDTVRGYDERVISGDQGWLLVNELRTPAIVLGNLTGMANAQDWIQGLVFCDYGAAVNRSPLINQLYKLTLLSVGLGFRYQVAENFRVRFDYGFQLNEGYLNAPGAAFLGHPADRRAHFGLELSF
jgi:hemolysin activation/secretion protein